MLHTTKRFEGPAIDLDDVCGRIARCKIDFAFTLVVETDVASYDICIENDFMVRTADGSEIPCSPERPSSLAPALDLLHQEVSTARVDAGATLMLSTHHGLELQVQASADYEAWNISSALGVLFVCAPGGALVTWKPLASH